MPRLSAVGIFVLQGGEDVKLFFSYRLDPAPISLLPTRWPGARPASRVSRTLSRFAI